MFRKLKVKILKSIKSKRINIFFLFLIVSFVILLISKLSETYTNTITFSLVSKQVPDKEVIISKDTYTLNIALKAQGFNLVKYYFNKPELYIDFSKQISKTDSVYIWNKNTGYSDISAQFGKSEELVNISPDTLWFRYDVNAVKKVPVKLHTDLKFGLGYDLLETFTIEPDSITIIGPHVLIANIKQINTDTLELKNIKSNIQTTLNLRLPDSLRELKFSDNSINLKAEVSKFTEGKLKIPVTIKNVPDSINMKYFPKKIAVTYYTSLNDFSNIKPEDFEVVCDYSKLVSGQSYLQPKIVRKPKLVKNVKINQQQIEFIITE